jgi:hypothetical protein
MTPLRWFIGVVAAAIIGAIVAEALGYRIQLWGISLRGLLGLEKQYSLTISTQVAFCRTGDVRELFGPDGPQNVDLDNDSGRTRICDNARLDVAGSDVAKALSTTYPGCFSLDYGIRTRLQLIKWNRAVCRAPYRLVGGTVEATTPEQGIFLCLGPEKTQSPVRQTAVDQGRTCTDDELRTAGFLSQQ